MGGHYLDQPLPNENVEMIDPFLLIHHWADKMPGDERQKDVGVGPHPHRGFSPVTYIYKGDIQHRDSLGNNAIVGEDHTSLIYLFDGKLELNTTTVNGKDLVWFENDGEKIKIESIEETRFIVLSGKPLDEPVVSYGPFVMNKQTEIMAALRDSQEGRMGKLIEEF
jgi:redox-sensitive bicupin YhaK (pirin superfamily)